MKKLIVMLIAGVAVSSAFASKVKWGTSAVPADWGTKDGTMYLIYATALPDTTTWSTKTTFTSADVLAGTSAKYVNDSNGIQMSHVIDSGNGYKWADTAGTTSTLHPEDLDGSGAANGARKFYLAILSDDGSQLSISTLKSANIAAADSTAVNLTWTLSSNFTTYKAASGVPEPTSGLLLALGGAMLALRRRRR